MVTEVDRATQQCIEDELAIALKKISEKYGCQIGIGSVEHLDLPSHDKRTFAYGLGVGFMVAGIVWVVWAMLPVITQLVP